MDYLDSRELEEELKELLELKEAKEEYDEVRLKALEELKEECENYGWEYGITFIPEFHWEEYARELFDDCYGYDIPENLKHYINYKEFASDLELDYNEIEFLGNTYYWREA